MYTFAFLLWLIPVVLIWVKYDRMPHAPQTLFLIIVLPLIITDEVLRFSGSLNDLSFLVGLFQFMPVLLASMVFICIHKMLLEKPIDNQWLHFLIPALFFLAEIPFLILPEAIKVSAFSEPPVGDILGNWPFYLYYLLSSFVILVYALKIDEMIKDYNYYLSEQVVDVGHFEMPPTMKLFGGLITISFGALLLIVMVALGLVNFDYWQGIISLLQVSIFYVITLLLLQGRSYSPNPLVPEDLEDRSYSEEHMRTVLAKAENAIIRNKLYKTVGLRLRTLSELAGVEPKELVVSSRRMLNRNFRAYMYHYRLEYAKKIILRSDVKISAVAKRLGFTSEKALSDMFVKYVQNLATDTQLSDKELEHLMSRKD